MGLLLMQAILFSLNTIPNSLIATISRLSIAGVYWNLGQEKIEGLGFDLVTGDFSFGVPRFSETSLELFTYQYHLTFVPPNLAFALAAIVEIVCPIFILFGLLTRVSALMLFLITLVVELFVYPDSYPTYGVWFAVLLFLIARGAGVLSLDHALASCYRDNEHAN